jgi:integrase
VAPTYLVRHGKEGWKYKRACPPDVRPTLRRKTWIKTLGTISHAAAIVEARQLAAIHDALIKSVRAMPEAERHLIADAGGREALERDAAYFERRLGDIRWALDRLDSVDLPDRLVVTTNKLRRLKRRVEARVAVTRKVLAPPVEHGLAALIPIWKQVSGTRSPKVVQKMHLYVARFTEIVGVKAPENVTRGDVLAFRDVIERDYPRPTAVKMLENIHALLNAAVKQGTLPQNVAHGIKVLTRASDDDGKLPFQPHQVRTIFKRMEEQSADFQWIVRLCAYHGMRSGEACQVRVEDVTTDMGLPVIHIHGRHGSVKNRASRRTVPIHPACMGIVAHARQGAGPWLFPSLPTHWQAGRGAWFQKEGNLWLRKIGIADRRLSMHSLRHTFRTLAREVGMPDSVACAIGGWSLGKGEHAAYGSVPSLRLRAEWLAKIDPLGHREGVVEC